jgi:hypothetical protein
MFLIYRSPLQLEEGTTVGTTNRAMQYIRLLYYAKASRFKILVINQVRASERNSVR